MHRSRKRKRARHRVWQLQEAKAKFSELVDEVLHDGYQTITRNGKPVVVVLSQEEFEQYVKPEENLIDFFMKAPLQDEELDLTRDKDTGRELDL